MKRDFLEKLWVHISTRKAYQQPFLYANISFDEKSTKRNVKDSPELRYDYLPSMLANGLRDPAPRTFKVLTADRKSIVVRP